jgi:hypothetical protein
MDNLEKIWASDIAARQKDLGLELVTNIYVSDATGRIIFAPLFWADTGLLYEQGNPFVEDFNAPDESLGAAIKRSLMMYARNAEGFKRRQSREWPAFEVSLQRTKSGFKSKYVLITVETTKTNFRFEALKDYEDQVFVGSYISPGRQDEDLGLLLKRLYAGAMLLRSALPE